jgi:hypothetical protein
MTSKTITQKILNGIFIAFTLALLLAIGGFRLDLEPIELSSREFEGFALFVLFGLLWLIYEIASSDSAL